MPVGSEGAQRASALSIRVAIIVVLGALLALSSGIAAPDAARGADERLKAVIVVGPSGNTSSNINDANEIAATATRHGMVVTKLYSPYASFSRVVTAARGASLLVYLGHGNGWPSPYGSFTPETKNGMGLNAVYGERAMKYYGEAPIDREIQLAPNAVVLLNHLCYASGNAEPGMARPTKETAIKRVDNFAAGFLRAGARAVYAYAWESVSSVIDGLFVPGKTIDQIFMTRTGTKGFVGTHDFRVASVRTPGKTAHLDPNYDHGYQRSVVGDLGMTSDAFRNGPKSVTTTPSPSPAPTVKPSAAPTATPSPVPTTRATASPSGPPAPPPAPPVPQLTSLAAQHMATTPRGSASDPAVFTPNGDAISDAVSISYGVSHPALLDVTVRNAAGTAVRSFTHDARTALRGTFTWDGRSGGDRIQADGTYSVTATPRSEAGGIGEERLTPVRILTALRAPYTAPRHFFARDDDTLAKATSATVTLTREAVLRWTVVDAAGSVVQSSGAAKRLPAGEHAFRWGGRRSTGAWAPDGRYFLHVNAQTPAGTYSHRLPISTGAFRVTPSAQRVARGGSVTLELLSAEVLNAYPRVVVAQPGLSAYTVTTTRVAYNLYRATVNLRTGGQGGLVTFTVKGQDRYGGNQSTIHRMPLD